MLKFIYARPAEVLLLLIIMAFIGVFWHLFANVAPLTTEERRKTNLVFFVILIAVSISFGYYFVKIAG